MIRSKVRRQFADDGGHILIVADRDDERAAFRRGQFGERLDQGPGGSRVVGGIEHDRSGRPARTSTRPGSMACDRPSRMASARYAPPLVPQFGHRRQGHRRIRCLVPAAHGEWHLFDSELLPGDGVFEVDAADEETGDKETRRSS